MLANLIPLIGALAWGWSILEIVGLYWAENIVIGLFTVFRLLTVAIPETGTAADSFAMAGKLAMSVFFTFHYGLFCLVHGVFVFALLGGSRSMVSPGEVLSLFAGPLKWALLALLVSHGFSFFANYLGKGQHLTTSLPEQMFAPYPRLIVLHLAIILGAFAIQALGSPVVLLALLVVGKTILDLALQRLTLPKNEVSESRDPNDYAREWVARFRK